MIHILNYTNAFFDYNPEVLLQYVDIRRIFDKFISETEFIKNKLNNDNFVFYNRLENDKRIDYKTFSEYINTNNPSILVFNIDIFDTCYSQPNYELNILYKTYPNVKFVVISDETFFRYTELEYNQSNVFYIVNGITNPYSFENHFRNCHNLTNYYIVNLYLQEYYVTFIQRLYNMSKDMVKDKKYNFYNGVHKPHRLKCYEIIKNNNLLNEGYFSYADFALLSKNDDENEKFMKFLDIDNVDEYKKYLSNFEIPLLYDTKESDPNVFVAFTNPPQTSLQSYISITTETFFQTEDDRDLVFSEKSFKPFYGFNIPLVIGQPMGLRYLKDLGFDLFEDFFDITPKYKKEEIFEQFEKNVKRIKSMSKMEIHNFYQNNIDRIEYNFELLVKILKERDGENLNNFFKK